MKKGAVKLADIAAKTGYSVNTVSHALHDKQDIAEETKIFIRKTAEEMGYIVNSSASFLRSGRSKSVAVIVGDISNPHFSIMIKEIEKALRIRGYTAFIFNTDENEEIERNAIRAAKSKNTDGIILCPVQKSEENINYLKTLALPYVLIGRHYDTAESAGYVVCDDKNSGYIAARHLIQNNHKNILFMNAPNYISSARERLAGIMYAAEQNGLPQSAVRVCEFPATMDGNPRRMAEILSAHAQCTAVICFSDFQAMQAVHILKEMGKRIPEDISVIGFDNIASKFYFPIMLTSITSSKTKMSQSAVEMLLGRIEGAVQPQGIVLPTKLIKRESTRKI